MVRLNISRIFFVLSLKIFSENASYIKKVKISSKLKYIMLQISFTHPPTHLHARAYTHTFSTDCCGIWI